MISEYGEAAEVCVLHRLCRALSGRPPRTPCCAGGPSPTGPCWASSTACSSSSGPSLSSATLPCFPLARSSSSTQRCYFGFQDLCVSLRVMCTSLFPGLRKLGLWHSCVYGPCLHCHTKGMFSFFPSVRFGISSTYC